MATAIEVTILNLVVVSGVQVGLLERKVVELHGVE
jgi:hypothetical protein